MNGLLKCSGTARTKNIGDYIQTVAQEQFWNKIDCYVERESLNSICSDEPINVIMNGWYMWNPQNFPPSSCVNPLFVSIHINPKCADEFFSDSTVSYLKKYEPIGARDKGTEALLMAHGIKSYFSACLTITLGLRYKSYNKNGKIIFVDPYVFRKETPLLLFKSLLKACIHYIKHPIKTNKLCKKINFRITQLSIFSLWLDKHLAMASFYNVYSKTFDDDLLFNADYLTHNINNINVTDDEKMQKAKNLIHLYAGAKLIITSRIHAALPCLGLETPVIFIPSKGLDVTRMNAGRFQGIEEFFHIVRWKDNNLILESDVIKEKMGNNKITRNISFENPTTYIRYKNQLIKTVSDFCNFYKG